MAKKTNDTEGVSGFGIALAAAAAAGVYFLYGAKDAKKNRKAVKGWVLKAKGEVLEKMEKVKGEINEENYHKLVDGVMAKYRSIKDAHQEEIDSVVKEMKDHWKNIKKHVASSVVKPAKKAVKKAAKKAAKKLS